MTDERPTARPFPTGTGGPSADSGRKRPERPALDNPNAAPVIVKRPPPFSIRVTQLLWVLGLVAGRDARQDKRQRVTPPVIGSGWSQIVGRRLPPGQSFPSLPGAPRASFMPSITGIDGKLAFAAASTAYRVPNANLSTGLASDLRGTILAIDPDTFGDTLYWRSDLGAIYTPRAPGEAIPLFDSSLALDAYESGRPSADDACRLGDPRVLAMRGTQEA